MKLLLFSSLLILSIAAAADTQPIRLTQIAGNLDRPIDIVHPGDGSGRLFIVLQEGKIVVYNGTRVLPKPFLNITGAVSCCGEQGLLSLAFHPQYETNGFFYVYYVNTTGNLVLARYKVSSRENIANKNSRRILLTIPHPQFGNHNGGKLLFGKDGFLYLSVGDGGGGGDQNNNAQNLGTLLGKILRLNVNGPSPYSIPADNPFVNRAGAREEIWAYGLRNPWRISFDKLRGHLYIGDVGQGEWEEINFENRRSSGGVNYGWRRMEGRHCFNPPSNCNIGGLKLPVAEYDHSQGCAVTGGFVYRGTSIPSLRGTYLYADYCRGTIWGLRKVAGKWTNQQQLSSGMNISTFGEDENGELYIANHSPDGAIFRIERN
jgi:glucose/arabinose dehydrogenase